MLSKSFSQCNDFGESQVIPGLLAVWGLVPVAPEFSRVNSISKTLGSSQISNNKGLVDYMFTQRST